MIFAARTADEEPTKLIEDLDNEINEHGVNVDRLLKTRKAVSIMHEDNQVDDDSDGVYDRLHEKQEVESKKDLSLQNRDKQISSIDGPIMDDNDTDFPNVVDAPKLKQTKRKRKEKIIKEKKQ